MFSLVFAFAVTLGIFINKLHVESQNLKKCDDGLHRICRSHLEGKIAGKPCSMCRLKWEEINSPKTMQDKIIEYAERKYGKKFEDFTNSEATATVRMMFE